MHGDPGLPAAVTVGTLEQARHAASEARRLGVPVLLATEHGACARAGPGYLLEMMKQAGADGDRVRALIDCGPDPGYAMLALRLGWRELHATGESDTMARLADMTRSSGGVFHHRMPPSLDLCGALPADRSLARWLCPDAPD